MLCAEKTVQDFMKSAGRNFDLNPAAQSPDKGPAFDPSSTPQTAAEAKERGNFFYKDGHFQKAVDLYSQAINMCPSDDEDNLKIYHSNRSAALFGLKRFEESRADALRCTQLDSVWAKGWYRKGLAEEGLERYKEAEESFRRGVDCAPTDQNLQRALQEVKMMI